MMRVFLFPGQGSQRPGMGQDFYDRSPVAREIFDTAAAIGPPGFLDTLFTSDQETLNQTRIAQPALLAVEVAIARHLIASGIHPAGCAGHSLGEIPALVSAGVLDFKDALPFVQERARLMSDDVPEGGMAAVIGLAPETIEAMLPREVQIANYNSPEQTIITGPSEALANAISALEAAEAKRVIPLKVSGPFHSKFMQHASDQLEPLLEKLPFAPPSVHFVSSVSGKKESDPETIRALLIRQLVQPVQWTRVMQCIGPVDALEIGPGAVLKGLAKRTPNAPRVTAIDTLEEAGAVGAE